MRHQVRIRLILISANIRKVLFENIRAFDAINPFLRPKRFKRAFCHLALESLR